MVILLGCESQQSNCGKYWKIIDVRVRRLDADIWLFAAQPMIHEVAKGIESELRTRYPNLVMRTVPSTIYDIHTNNDGLGKHKSHTITNGLTIMVEYGDRDFEIQVCSETVKLIVMDTTDLQKSAVDIGEIGKVIAMFTNGKERSAGLRITYELASPDSINRLYADIDQLMTTGTTNLQSQSEHGVGHPIIKIDWQKPGGDDVARLGITGD